MHRVHPFQKVSLVDRSLLEKVLHTCFPQLLFGVWFLRLLRVVDLRPLRLLARLEIAIIPSPVRLGPMLLLFDGIDELE